MPNSASIPPKNDISVPQLLDTAFQTSKQSKKTADILTRNETIATFRLLSYQVLSKGNKGSKVCGGGGRGGGPEGGREPEEGLLRPLGLMGGPPSFMLPAGDAIGDSTPDVWGDRSCN